MGDYSKTLKTDESSLLVHYVYRPLAYPIAKAAHRLGMTANQMTVISGLCWILSLPLFPMGAFLAIGGESETQAMAGWELCLVAGFLWNVGTVLDVADGSLARLTGTSSPAGFYLDYVFHLLFKPGFLVSIGMVASLVVGKLRGDGDSIIWLILPFLSVPLAPMLNWSASHSAAEHVLCELKGKGKLPENVPRETWLGANDSADSIEAKRSSTNRLRRGLAAECLSYYGQSTFFSLLVLVDFLLGFLLGDSWFIPFVFTTLAYWLLFFAFLLRLPFRVAGDFQRMKALAGPRDPDGA